MIKKNLAAEPYVWSWDWNATYSDSDSASLVSVAAGEITLTWGSKYIAATMGIKITISTTSANPATGAAASYYINFDSPWYTATIASGTSFLGSATIRVEADGVTNIGPCYGTTFSFSEIRIYVGSTLIHTISAQTISSGYTPLLNVCVQYCNSTCIPAAIATTPTCPDTKPSGSSSISHTSKCSLKGGWKRSGVSDTLVFYAPSPIPPGCGCDAPLVVVVYHDSHDVFNDADYEFGFVVSDLGTFACECTGGGGSPGSVEQFKFEAKIFKYNSYVTFTQKDEGIYFRRDQTASSCNGGPTETTDHTYNTSPDTYSLIHSEGSYDVRTTYCNYKLPGPSFCPAGSTLVCPLPTGSVCYSTAVIDQSWPVTPDCTYPANECGYDVSLAVTHARAYINGAGHLIIGTTDNSVATWADIDTGITAAWARCRFVKVGSSLVLGVMYGDGSTITWAQTVDGGTTLINSSSFGSGTLGDFEETKNGVKWDFKILSSDGGTTYDVWSQLRDNALNVLQAWTITNVTGIDNAGLATRESLDPTGAWRIGLFYFVGGVPTVKYSPNGLAFS